LVGLKMLSLRSYFGSKPGSPYADSDMASRISRKPVVAIAFTEPSYQRSDGGWRPLSQTLTGFWRGRFSRHLGQQAAIHSKGISLQPPLHCEPALAGALDSVQPIEQPQSRCDGQVEDGFTYRALPRLNLPSAFTIHAFWLARLWRTRRGTVPGARLFDLSGRFHGETSLVV